MFTTTIGTSCDSWRITVRPFGSCDFVNGMLTSEAEAVEAVDSAKNASPSAARQLWMRMGFLLRPDVRSRPAPRLSPVTCAAAFPAYFPGSFAPRRIMVARVAAPSLSDAEALLRRRAEADA